MEPKAGDRFGPYEIVSRIGSGGMGQVWRARDSRLKRDVAIKFLAPHLERDPLFRRRFDAEAAAVAQLSHPNISQIYDVGDSYLVMELLDGETLASRIARGPLPIEDAALYGAEIAAGLAAAHERGIVHRDLKPGNVMITKGGAKLLDFGLASTNAAGAPESAALTAPFSPLTKENTVVGTLQYMAPEQFEGGQTDARSDIFALGVVLFEMLSGKHPFVRPTRQATVAALVGQDWPSLRHLRDDIPVLLEEIIRRCVARDPADRWQSASDVARMLRWFTAEGKDFSPTAQRIVRPRRGLLWTAAAVIIIAIIALPIWIRSRPSAAGRAAPMVLLADSTNPERIYSPRSRASGATNADDLTDVLRDLPVTLVKENTNALWSREDQVVKEAPALIVIHRSAFAERDEGLTPEEVADVMTRADRRVQSFLGYIGLASPRTRFIVYSRNWEVVGGAEPWVGGVVARFPYLRGRVSTIAVTGGQEKSFRDPESAARVHAEVLRALEMDRSALRR